MASYIYPAVFKRCDDSSFFVRFPDIPNGMTQGFSLDEALYMAGDVLRICAEEALERGEQLSPPSDIAGIKLEEDEFASYIRAETRSTKAVKKTVSIPKWMADKAEERHISLSRTLQAALEEKLNA